MLIKTSHGNLRFNIYRVFVDIVAWCFRLPTLKNRVSIKLLKIDLMIEVLLSSSSLRNLKHEPDSVFNFRFLIITMELEHIRLYGVRRFTTYYTLYTAHKIREYETSLQICINTVHHVWKLIRMREYVFLMRCLTL